MVTGARFSRGQSRKTPFAILTAQAASKGDMGALSSGTVIRASDWTWTTDLPTTQAAFAAAFCGIIGQTKIANVARVYGNSADNLILCDDDDVWEFDCASATFTAGDVVGPAKQSGNFLENQKVVAVADEAHAIGRVETGGANLTRVKVRVMGRKQQLLS